MSLSIDDNTVASIHYTLTNSAGEMLDSSQGNDPLIYLHGAANLIPGLEKELKGKSAGHSMQVKVAPEEGYGPVHDGLIDIVPKTAFQGVDTIEPGMAFEAQGEDGQTRRITVTAINGDDVTVDANHPLAGVELHFDVEIVEVRDATEEEIANGHAH
jgi:FKBP-type peptidyl-prolyl cis-trans isomerase SlyD